MDKSELIKKLSNIDALETWGDYCKNLTASDKQEVFSAAEQLWIERMARNMKLLLHPEVLAQLELQSWKPNDLQKKMIWASVLASAEGDDSKQRFQIIKSKLLKKYGRDWWEDVFRRKTNAWAAKERIRKTVSSYGPAVSTLISHTHLFAGMAVDDRDSALRMIPKD